MVVSECFGLHTNHSQWNQDYLPSGRVSIEKIDNLDNLWPNNVSYWLQGLNWLVTSFITTNILKISSAFKGGQKGILVWIFRTILCIYWLNHWTNLTSRLVLMWKIKIERFSATFLSIQQQGKGGQKVVWSTHKNPKLTIFQRYPKATLITSVVTCLTIFFSRPLYDCFLVPGIKPLDDKK